MKRLHPLVLSVAFLTVAACLLWSVAAPADEPKTDSGMISRGGNLFKQYCRSCHGNEAKGDGPVAEYLRVPPADLTRLAERNGGEFDFEAVAAKIDGREMAAPHGSPDMPIWGDAFMKTDDGDAEAVQRKILALTHYLRSLQAPAE